MSEALEKRLADMERMMETLKLAMDTKEAEAATARAEAQAAKEELQSLLDAQDKSAARDDHESSPKLSPPLQTPDQGMPRTLYVSSDGSWRGLGGDQRKQVTHPQKIGSRTHNWLWPRKA